MKIIENRKVEITVKRPNGKIETLIHPKIDYMTDGILAQMRKAMRDANRGEVISYRNIGAVVEMDESDYRERCERCGTPVDTRTAHKQQQPINWGGKTIKGVAYYCDSCRHLLTQIGLGEHTAMQERAGQRPDSTPIYKED